MGLKFWEKLGEKAVEVIPRFEGGKIKMDIKVGKVICSEERLPYEMDDLGDCFFYPEQVYKAVFDPFERTLSGNFPKELNSLLFRIAWLFNDEQKPVKLLRR